MSMINGCKHLTTCNILYSEYIRKTYKKCFKDFLFFIFTIK